MRIGIIGLGGAGLAHIRYFNYIEGCEVTKAYDTKEAGLDRARQHGLVACSSLEEFWDDLDIVSICSPDSTHADYTVEALERGKHVVIEKPLADTTEGLRRIKEAEEKSEGILAVQHQMRFIPRNQKIKEYVGTGKLGTISYCEALYVHNLTTRAYLYDDWRKVENATPLVYSGCHSIDLLRWFLGEEPVEVYGAANNLAFPGYPESDLNVLTYRFESGVLGTVMVAFGAACPQDHSVKIHGNERAIENNVVWRKGGRFDEQLERPRLIQPQLLNSPTQSKLSRLFWQLRDNGRSYAHDLVWRVMRRLTPSAEYQYGVRFYPMRLYEHQQSCTSSLQDFVDAIREGRRPLCTFEEAAKTVLACLAGVESYRTNKPVRVQTLDEVLAGEPASPAAPG